MVHRQDDFRCIRAAVVSWCGSNCPKFRQTGRRHLYMFNRRLSPWIQSAMLAAALSVAAICAVAQDQKLPDAPTPQNNAPAPSVNLPSQEAPGDQPPPSSGNPEPSPNTRTGAQQPQEPANPQPPPPGSEGVKTVPAGGASNGGESGRDELFRLQRTVSFVTVPVTVKDNDGKLVDGLLQSDFSIYEDGGKQEIKLFTSDPFPLSAALIIDQGLPDLTLKKVNQHSPPSADRLAPSTRCPYSPMGIPSISVPTSATRAAWKLLCSASRMSTARRSTPRLWVGPLDPVR